MPFIVRRCHHLILLVFVALAAAAAPVAAQAEDPWTLWGARVGIVPSGDELIVDRIGPSGSPERTTHSLDEDEYWDTTGANRLDFVWRAGKALIQGEQFEYDRVGEHAKVEL